MDRISKLLMSFFQREAVCIGPSRLHSSNWMTGSDPSARHWCSHVAGRRSSSRMVPSTRESKFSAIGPFDELSLKSTFRSAAARYRKPIATEDCLRLGRLGFQRERRSQSLCTHAWRHVIRAGPFRTSLRHDSPDSCSVLLLRPASIVSLPSIAKNQ